MSQNQTKKGALAGAKMFVDLEKLDAIRGGTLGTNYPFAKIVDREDVWYDVWVASADRKPKFTTKGHLQLNIKQSEPFVRTAGQAVPKDAPPAKMTEVPLPTEGDDDYSGVWGEDGPEAA